MAFRWVVGALPRTPFKGAFAKSALEDPAKILMMGRSVRYVA